MSAKVDLNNFKKYLSGICKYLKKNSYIYAHCENVSDYCLMQIRVGTVSQ